MGLIASSPVLCLCTQMCSSNLQRFVHFQLLRMLAQVILSATGRKGIYHCKEMQDTSKLEEEHMYLAFEDSSRMLGPALWC